MSDILKSSFFLRVTGVAAALVVSTLGCAACSTVAVDLNVGECIKLPSDADLDNGFEVSSVSTTACSKSHDGEVVGMKTIRGESYPGQDELYAQAKTFCRSAFKDYTGEDLDSSPLEVFPLLPTKDSWSHSQDRALVCVAVSRDDPLHKSLKKNT
ncbi:septum formation family protein [Gleimia hominis]|uniref:septum formation family protein n=1 Tax=Gleimia hominis TaxID=595468 RepID=UPI00130445F3|nr:septum formation family protein [Gleimia hominis]WIK63855.1 septum formation family protein [Gleimia hominis]